MCGEYANPLSDLPAADQEHYLTEEFDVGFCEHDYKDNHSQHHCGLDE